MKIVLAIILALGVYLGVTNLFSLREITVVGDSSFHVEIDAKRLPKTLLFFPSEKLRTEILAENPILSDLRFEKKYPHTLVIVPTVRMPSAIVVTATRRVFVDEGGVVVADADTVPRGVPQITSPISGVRIGQKISDSGVTSALTFILAMKTVIPIETATISEDGVIQAHGGNLDILFTQTEDVSSVITTLQTSLAGFRIKGTLPKVIDLRFDKPVVRF